jgi:hypothetical protein
MQNNKEVYVVTEQERELLACGPFMEKPTDQDIRTDRVVDSADELAETSTVYFFDSMEKSIALNWLRNNGFRPVADAAKIMY